jgi:catechol 2,3-dioxygenase-like lactoylglutathione lyase family enzyme
MFNKTQAFSSFAVPDLQKAKEFYGNKLGITVNEENGMLFLHFPEKTRVLIYPKPDHTPATFTVLNLPVESVEDTVDKLNKLGVRFEVYDAPEYKTDDKGIMRVGDSFKTAWFKDPAGNILSIMEGG